MVASRASTVPAEVLKVRLLGAIVGCAVRYDSIAALDTSQTSAPASPKGEGPPDGYSPAGQYTNGAQSCVRHVNPALLHDHTPNHFFDTYVRRALRPWLLILLLPGRPTVFHDILTHFPQQRLWIGIAGSQPCLPESWR